MLHSYKTYNFKIFPFLLHGYHTPQLKNIAFPAIAFLSHNFKILPTCHMEFFRVSSPTQFFWEIGRNCVNYNYYFLGQAIWGQYPFLDGEKVSLVFLGCYTSKY